MNAEIKADQVLTVTKQLLRLGNTNDQDILLYYFINEGARAIGSTEILVIKNCEVTVENNRFTMPKDAKRIIAFRGENSCYQGVFVDVAFFTQCGCGVGGFGNILSALTQQGRVMYFLSTVPDDTIVQIAYSALNTNSDGELVINEEQEIALSRYAAWNYGNMFPKDFTDNQVARWQQVWSSQSARCRGLAARRTFNNQKAQISSKMNAILSFGQMPYFLNWFNNFLYTNNP